MASDPLVRLALVFGLGCALATFWVILTVVMAEWARSDRKK